MRIKNLNLKLLMEMLKTFPNEIGAINMELLNDNEGAKGAIVKCMFNTGYIDYITFGITTSHKFYFSRASEKVSGIPTEAVPAITFHMFLNGERVEVALAIEDIKNDTDISKDVIQIIDQINSRLIAKEKRWLDKESETYDKTLSLREIDNARFLCRYIKKHIMKYYYNKFINNTNEKR